MSASGDDGATVAPDVRALASAAVAAAVAAGKLGPKSSGKDARFHAVAPDVPAWAIEGAWSEARAALRDNVKPIRPDVDTGDERRVIVVSSELQDNIDAAIAALGADPDLYHRARELVRVIRDGDEPPVIEPHTAATLRARLTCFARFQSVNAKGETIDVIPTDPIVKGILEAKIWPGLRRLSGVLESPAMRPDYGLIDQEGWDPLTGFLYLPSRHFPQVDASPTLERSRRALRYLWTELCFDFPFRGMGYPDPGQGDTPEGCARRFDDAVACPDAWGLIAAIFTVAARPAIKGSIPGIIFDASTPGSGKGLQVDLAAITTVGRVPAKLTWPNRGDDTDDHVNKMLAGEARRGVAITVMDEITGPFGGPSINNVLTGKGRALFRILGESKTEDMPWNAVLLGAGNNFTYMDNTHRRIIVPRLEPPEEKPEEHKGFRHDHVDEWAMENRGDLMCAALTVLRGYVEAGMPDVDLPRMASFEQWSELVPRAIKWAGGGNVLGCRPTVDPESRNEEGDRMAAVLDAVARLMPKDDRGASNGEGIAISNLISRLYPADQVKFGSIPDDDFTPAREAIEGLTGAKSGHRPDGSKLGAKMKVWKRRAIGPRALDRAKNDRNGSARWHVISAKDLNRR